MILLFIVVFFGYVYYEKEQLNQRIHDDYSKIAKYIYDNRMNPSKIEEYVTSLHFELAENPIKIIDNNKLLRVNGRGFEMIEDQNDRYLHVVHPAFRFLFKDLNSYKQNQYGSWILSFIFVLAIFTFMWILKTLKPLNDLKDKIAKFSNGDLSIECRSDKKDEIAQVANEFDNAVKKIALLLESRQLFLRTVMHELKTPIAKGKIVCSLIDDKVQQQRISMIFDKLNFLINDFAKIEQVISHNYVTHMSFFSIGSVLKSAIDMMMLENPDKKITVENISNQKLRVDLELFALAIKNLLDNGIKYSVDKKVHVSQREDALIVSSKGEKLAKPLEEYFKPFHNDTKAKNHGMGLGLYIVHSIAKMHNVSLEYEYKKGINSFSLHFISQGDIL
jgi:two-component system OmpR family sensor kinase